MAATFSVSPEVRAVLERATIEPRSVTLNGKLERELYLATNKVLEAAGGTWNRKLKAHIFDRDPREALGLAIATGKATNVKQELQAFYSPPAVAKRVAKRAEIAWPMTVLEPSAGVGALADEAAAALMSTAPVGTTGPDVRDMVKCYDVDGVAVEKLRALGYRDPEQRDFLQVAPGTDFYDRVVMNPPFTRGAALEHILHAFSFLKPGGILVAVMPGRVSNGYAARAAIKKAFEDLVATSVVEREDLPVGSFRESGTDVATHILVLRKAKARATRATPKAIEPPKRAAVQREPSLLDGLPDPPPGALPW